MAPTEPLPEPPSRTCPHCGKEGRTTGERCPHCARSYYVTTAGQKRRRWLIAAAVAVVVVALGVVGAVLALNGKDDRDARVKASRTVLVARLRAKITRVQAPHHGSAPALKAPAHATTTQRLAARKALVTAVERRITLDAQARAQAGELDGPIGSTQCGPILKSKQAIPDDRVLSKRIGRYDCVAIKREVDVKPGEHVADLGYPFVAALDFDTTNYTWCRNTPAQGEAGVALVFVRLDRSCLAAKGKALGTGYVAEPGEQGTATVLP